MEDDEKMEEDKEETGNELTGAKELEEEHQKARAIASPEVEDHNLTHLPFRAGVHVA